MPTKAERSRILEPLLLVAVAAWVLLGLSSYGLVVPELCLTRSTWFLPSADHYTAMLAFTPLQVLAAGWVVMVAAMMTPLLFVPLVQVHSASLKRVQPLATGFFAAGYFAIWIVAGSAFLSLALTMRIASGGGRGAFLVALAVATIWQMSPGKQAALNRCHGRRPLAAFGAAAYWDSLMAGLTHGGWCLASCWALMLAALVAPAFHFAAMLFVSLYVWAERLEHPRKPEWSLGVPTRVLCAFAWRLKNWDLGGYATRLFAQSRE